MPPKGNQTNKNAGNPQPEGKAYTQKELAEITANAKAEAEAEAAKAKEQAEAEAAKNAEIIKANAKAEAMKELAQESNKRSIADDYTAKHTGKVKHYFAKTSGRSIEFSAFDRFGKDKKGPSVPFKGHLFKTDDENLQKLIESTRDFREGKVTPIHPEVAAKLEGKAMTKYVHGAATTVNVPDSQKEPAVVE